VFFTVQIEILNFYFWSNDLMTLHMCRMLRFSTGIIFTKIEVNQVDGVNLSYHQ